MVQTLHSITNPLGITALIIFAISYVFVMAEEFTHLRKSKPVILAAGIIWALVAIVSNKAGYTHLAEKAIRHNILEFAELFLFLLSAMTYINAMEERQVFESLRAWLVRKQFSYRQLFWVTGCLAFLISPFADNLTTALLMCAVVTAVGKDHPNFVALSCINIVVAANAGGAFSPFGDITTLMVWQKNIIPFDGFFHIFFPALLSFLIPAICMHFAVENQRPMKSEETISLKIGAKRIITLFVLTILTAIGFHQFLHLPPTIGMMTGLGYLMLFSYYLKKHEAWLLLKEAVEPSKTYQSFDIFNKIKRAEWDTLLFFYGVVLCVGGLATFGYLEFASNVMYNEWGKSLSAAQAATPANVIIGLLSAVIDNIPVMFAVLTMNPTMSEGQWLLVTLTAGIGGSLLSVGSAAGVALMGQTRGQYTFFMHLKWTWAIGLGYVAAVICHLWLNQSLF